MSEENSKLSPEEVIAIKKIILQKRRDDLEKEILEIKEEENKIVNSRNKEALIKYFKEEEE